MKVAQVNNTDTDTEHRTPNTETYHRREPHPSIRKQVNYTIPTLRNHNPSIPVHLGLGISAQNRFRNPLDVHHYRPLIRMLR
jgi:hypothetical protein